MSRERRKSYRYETKGVDVFVGMTSFTVVERREVSYSLQVESISGGGCGFYADGTDEEKRFKLGDRIVVQFCFQDNRCEPKHVKGEIVSITPGSNKGHAENYYALRFINPNESDLEELLEHVNAAILSLSRSAI